MKRLSGFFREVLYHSTTQKSMEIISATSKIVRADEGLRLCVIGDHQTLKLSGEDTNGQFTLIEQVNEPGTGIPWHVHSREDEVFTVLTGMVEFGVEGEIKTLRAGDLVYVPRGTAHSFKVVGDSPAKVILSVFPAGIEGMFRELAQLPPSPADFARVGEICGRYGITFR
jgi:quercetin dioxygenase-like cupin family protein